MQYKLGLHTRNHIDVFNILDGLPSHEHDYIWGYAYKRLKTPTIKDLTENTRHRASVCVWKCEGLPLMCHGHLRKLLPQPQSALNFAEVCVFFKNEQKSEAERELALSDSPACNCAYKYLWRVLGDG